MDINRGVVPLGQRGVRRWGGGLFDNFRGTDTSSKPLDLRSLPLWLRLCPWLQTGGWGPTYLHAFVSWPPPFSVLQTKFRKNVAGSWMQCHVNQVFQKWLLSKKTNQSWQHWLVSIRSNLFYVAGSEKLKNVGIAVVCTYF